MTVQDGASSWTRPLSGTSMSAAVVSGIAAAVWASYPGRTSAEVERLLIEPAVMLREASPSSASSSLCNALTRGPTPKGPNLAAAECRQVRRASLCGSLAQAAGDRATCGPAANEASPASPPVGVAPLADPGTKEPCIGSQAHACVYPDEYAIDSAEQPWLELAPQPGGNSCGTCDFARSQFKFTRALVPGGTALSAQRGLLQFSPTLSYPVWDEKLINPSYEKATTTNLAPRDLPAASGATLRYYRTSDLGNVWYTENVRIQ
jgi:hypothetical protein